MSSPVWLWLLCEEIPISWLCQYKLAVWWLELNDCVLTLIIIDINKYNLASWWSWPLHFCIAGSSTKRDYWPVKLLTIWKSTSNCFSQTKKSFLYFYHLIFKLLLSLLKFSKIQMPVAQFGQSQSRSNVLSGICQWQNSRLVLDNSKGKKSINDNFHQSWLFWRCWVLDGLTESQEEK